MNKRAPGVLRRIHTTPNHQIAVCSIIKAELFYGAMKSNHPTRTIARQKQFLGQFVSLPFDDQAAEVAGDIRAYLAIQGQPIGPNDLLIAAIAVANGLKLITHNVREFSRVKGLAYEDWEV